VRAALALAVVSLWPLAAVADDEPVEKDDRGFFLSERLPIRLDARLGFMFRNDRGYYHDARVFAEQPRVSTNTKVAEGDPIPPAGGGVVSAGVALFPRTTLAVSFAQFTNGVSEAETKLSLTSQRFGADLKFAPLFFHGGGSSSVWESWSARLDLCAGVGYYVMREDYLDRAVFDTTLTHVSHHVGGRFGIELAAYAGPLGAVIAYAYHLAPATVSDRIGGSIDAGGHEISIGLAVRLGP
jgi:hypothetical protein